MAYRFEADESVRNAMLRCAGEQLDRAVSELSERISSDPVEAVHAARKAVKKERSLLRIARGSMPAKHRRRENAALREAAQGLSGARDAEAMIATLDDLSERYAGQVPESTFHEIRQQLETRRDQQRGELVGSALGAQAVGELGAVRIRVEGLDARTERLESDRDRSPAQLHRRAQGVRPCSISAVSGEAAHMARSRRSRSSPSLKSSDGVASGQR